MQRGRPFASCRNRQQAFSTARVRSVTGKRMSPIAPQGSTSGPPPLRVRAEMGPSVEQGSEAGIIRQTFTFERSFRIGRTDECEICIKNEHVSRKHVEVVIDNGSWLVRGFGSANGIFGNGER